MKVAIKSLRNWEVELLERFSKVSGKIKDLKFWKMRVLNQIYFIVEKVKTGEFFAAKIVSKNRQFEKALDLILKTLKLLLSLKYRLMSNMLFGQ